jgi:hypothetical protein
MAELHSIAIIGMAIFAFLFGANIAGVACDVYDARKRRQDDAPR